MNLQSFRPSDRVVATSKIIIVEDSGPCPASRLSSGGYVYVAAERGDIATVISRDNGVILCAFERTRLVAEVTEKDIVPCEVSVVAN